jgi:hypothetical protein
MAVVLGLATTCVAQERADLEVVHRIKQEATRGSQVMHHLFALTDQNGPRLTGSPGFKRAADWAVGRLQAFGIGSARVASWGRFGRGWTLTRYEAHLLEPAYAALSGIPLAWSGGTNGTVTAEVVAAPLWTAQEGPDAYDITKVEARVKAYVAAQKGRLAGRIVLLDPAHGSAPRGRRASATTTRGWARRPPPELFAAPPSGPPLKTLPADPGSAPAVRERSHRDQRGPLPAPRGGRAAALPLLLGKESPACFAAIGGARGHRLRRGRVGLARARLPPPWSS